MSEDRALARCCPDADRIEGRETKGGLPIFDLHRHKGLLRGSLPSGDRTMTLHWMPGGRLSRGAESEYDIRRRA